MGKERGSTAGRRPCRSCRRYLDNQSVWRHGRGVVAALSRPGHLPFPTFPVLRAFHYGLAHGHVHGMCRNPALPASTVLHAINISSSQPAAGPCSIIAAILCRVTASDYSSASRIGDGQISRSSLRAGTSWSAARVTSWPYSETLLSLAGHGHSKVVGRNSVAGETSESSGSAGPGPFPSSKRA